MMKHKKKDAKKKKKKSKNSGHVLDSVALSIKKFRQVSKEIGKLSTGQKVIGGVALVAAGLAYLAKKESGQALDAATEADEAPLGQEAKLRLLPAAAPDRPSPFERTAVSSRKTTSSKKRSSKGAAD